MRGQDDERGIWIDRRVMIPTDELVFTFSRSSGPGGQNVNKVNTRATLRFDVRASQAFSPVQRERLLAVLAGRLDRDGCLVIDCQVHRSQADNRAEAIRKLATLLRAALRPPKVRHRTRPTKASVERRLASKTRRTSTKQHRRWRGGSDD